MAGLINPFIGYGPIKRCFWMEIPINYAVLKKITSVAVFRSRQQLGSLMLGKLINAQNCS